MKPTKKLEAEILKVYKTYWDAYLKGDMKTFASYLADDITVFGTAVSEIFNNKKETLRFYKATADQLVGKAQFRSRSIKMRAVDENILVNEQCDFYVLIEEKWMFYGHCRISSILKQTNSGWKLAHQHASFPDTRADEGEQVATKKMREENLQLRDAVKRRTIELEEKNRELEIEASVERVRAKALAMHSSEEIREVVRTLRNELFGLKLAGVTAVTICLKQDDGRVRFWDITDLETTGRYSADITFDMAQTHPQFYLQKIWSSKKKIIAIEQDSNDLKRTLKWLGQYDKQTADEITELIKVNKIKRGWHRAVKLANGRLITDFINEPPIEIESILLKMGAAFDLAYKRFLDLKNAEEQTKEARIELALERVRARAMAMHNSNELAELVSTVFNELTQLEFKLTSCIIWIHDHENTKNTLWIASTEMNKPAEPFLVNPFHNDFFKSISHAWKAKDTKWVYTFTGKEKKNFEKAFFKEIPQLPIPLKNALKVPEQVVFSASFNNFGALEIVETEALTEEKFEILHRFGKVFDLSYTRFNDLKKAEAQARDAQIETGLERVRSKTMAMHKSEEVTGIAVSLNEELMKLGFEGGSTIIIIDKETGDTEQWAGFSEDKTLKSCYVPYFKHPYHNAQLDAWKRGDKFLVYTLTGDEKKTVDEHYFATGYKGFPESDKKWMRQMRSVTFSHAFMKYGSIHWGPGDLTEEQLKILQRFSKVFEQSYTRFLDLQKAEAQVREAQIEAALERVRSRSMAMHKSDDLHEVIKVVTEQLFVLSLKFNVANFAKINQDGSWDLWLSTPEQAYPALIHVPYLDHPIFNRITEEEAKGNNFYTDVYTWEETNIFFHHFFENTIARNTPEERKQFVYSSKGLTRSVFQTKNIWFSVARYDITAFTDEENAIFKRFANVFEQAYTRFLDLQKAEAQARETEIELSLERVRAKTMAMQKPSEFVDIINIIGEQFVHLGFDIDWANFGANGFAISEGIDIWNFAVIPGASPISARVFIPYFDHPVFTTSAENIHEFLNGGRDLITVTFDKQTKDTWLDQLFTKTIFKDVPDEYRAIQYAKPGYTTSNISIKDTWLSIGKFDSRPFTDEQHLILRRFAKAFGQANTRFLDLQKAEAQAREAQIEASLERVRSRAMAMQNSDELRELIGTVFTELTKLDIVLTRCLIMIYDPRSNDSVWWMANSEAPTEPIGLRIQNHGHPPYVAYLKAWQEKKLNWVYVLEGAVKKAWDDFLFVETELSHLPDFVIAGMKAPERVYLNSSFNSFGNLTLATLEPLSNEHFDILLRFAKVFDLTYTRFNDLKQAEAQAKEAKIEAALERVRSRSMAMHSPQEIKDVALEMRNQLGLLEQHELEVCAIHLYEESPDYFESWAAIRPPGDEGKIIQVKAQFPKKGIKIVDEMFLQYEAGTQDYVLINEGVKVPEWLNILKQHIPDEGYKMVLQSLQGRRPEDTRAYWSMADFKGGSLVMTTYIPPSDDARKLLRRFANVFGLAYRRFIDLKNAETQKREAQIELALERVRARTMAMHKSVELAETAQVLFQQLSELGGIPDRISIGIADEATGVVNFWTTDQQGSRLDHSFSARLNERTTIAKTYQAWKEQKRSLVVDLHGEELKEWIQFAREEMGIAVKGDQIKDRRVHSLAFFSHGWILVSSHEPQSPDTIQILERFASVFNLTYRRFLDLQKAETQANEARIEIALERIRARALAMHKSDELMEVAKVMREQMALLGQPELEASVVHLYEEDPDHILSWRAFRPTDSHDKIAYGHMSLPKNSCEFVREWLTKFYSDEKEYTIELSGAKQDEWYDLFFKFAPDVINSMRQDNSIHDKRYYRFSKFSGGALLMISKQEPSEEATYLQKRAAVVFDLAYRRFSDLQKAEAQAREAQIEAVLERVRSRTMAMQKSDELTDVAGLLFEQVSALGIKTWTAGFNVWSEDNNSYVDYITSPQGGFIEPYTVYTETAEALTDISNARKSGVEFDVQYVDGEKIKQLYLALTKLDEKQYEIMLQDGVRFPSHQYEHFVFGSKVSLMFITYEPVPEAHDIFKRLGKVFEQTYTRFLDLQKAEAQAREAQIEGALEKVRSHTMGMRSSEDLANVASVMFDQMRILGGDLFSFGIVLCDKHENMVEQWHSIPGAGMLAPFFVPVNLDHIHQFRYDQWKAGVELFSIVIPEDYIAHHFELMLQLPSVKAGWEGIAAQGIALPPIPTWEIDYGASFRYGYLLVSALKPFEEDKIFSRFAKVFEQAYTRFLDLQKAEASAREAQIEASLERVRSKTMAMHNSQDVGETVATMFDELVKLGIEALRCGIGVMHEGYRMEVWTAKQGANNKAELVIGQMDMRMHALTKGVYSGWRNKEQSFSYELKDDDLIEYFTALNSSSEYPMRYEISSLPSTQFHNSFYFPEGVLYVFSLEQLRVEFSQICKRFAGIFGQTYRRFLDLQKAEAQAKEAQIEASLERVRSKTMAMHNSQDVGNTVATMFDQLVHLGVKTNRCGILIFSDTNNTEVWTAKSNQTGEAALIIGHLDVTIHPMLQGVSHAWKNKQTFYSYELAGDDIKNYYSTINNYRDYPTRFNLDSLPEKEIHSDFFFPEGAVFAFTSEPIAEEAALIFKRFAGVFGQTYRRYLDLQKAEANAREAQIEAGLERVRARTMAMHSSEDVSIATATMFTELEKLGIENFRGGITNIMPNRTQHVWSVNNLEEGKVLKSVGTFNIDAHPFWQLMYKEWEAKKDFIHYYLAGEDKQNYFEVLNAIQGYLPQNFQQYPDLHFQVYYFNEGAVWTNSLQPHSEEDKQVMKRFTSVFSLTYRRYQDLKKAEAQAKEATIEAALERVRGKAMAMHSSKDLASTIGIFYHELEGLNLTPRRCGVGLINKETMMAEISTMNASADGEGIELVGNLDLRSHPVLTGVYNNWLTKTEYHPVLRGNEIKEYYQIVRPQIDFPDYPNDIVQYGYFYFFEEGGVYTWTEKELNEDELKIYRRFTSVLSLTYKRYKDLKDSEARTHAAIKDAALDRIRADIASMRTINDLDRITPLIWNELTVLGIPFIRCGVFIMDEEQELIHTFLSTPDGKAIAAFHLPYDTPGNLNHVLINWKENRKYIDRWDESEFKQFADILVEQGTLASAEQYLKTIPPGGFYLHFLPFLQGMLYVGNTTQLNNDEIELIQHVADAFSTAYARYEDFNKLEAAKQQVDKTLTDLKQAQTQLVQSEKMASLGELTAGIAHEIQNPLNFVNNFSDVSSELLEEMKIELEKGNKEDAIAIVEDVKQNLEKILHHGKRADAIVKGMLQHSRTSSGQKEPTDVNILADEYLRLAFHGLRAKDKSFNAKFETEFDNSIEKINIIPQDIGRVILNLINNAFYAVTEKKKVNTNGYEPVVTVTTKKDSSKIEIKVKDNGNGIPQKVLDKIFQPFFTTKPTGQGTGLGLSLAYDIITKGHGGELKVETKEGEGSEFIIHLPA